MNTHPHLFYTNKWHDFPLVTQSRGFPGGSVVKNVHVMQETQVQSLCREDPLEENMATHSSIPAWRSHGLRSLVDYSPQGHKVSDMTEVTEHAHTQSRNLNQPWFSFPRTLSKALVTSADYSPDCLDSLFFPSFFGHSPSSIDCGDVSLMVSLIPHLLLYNPFPHHRQK